MSYEAWGEPDEIPECPHCGENAALVDDLARLVQRLARELHRAAPDNALVAQALGRQERNVDLCSSPLR